MDAPNGDAADGGHGHDDHRLDPRDGDVHDHGSLDTELVTNRRALRTVVLSALGLGATALAQFAASTGAAVGIAGAWLGAPLLDPVAGLAITAVIVWTLVDVGRPVLGRLLDATDPALVDVVRRAAHGDGVIGVHDVRVRHAGRAMFVQLHVAVDGHLPLRDAHAIAERVRHRILHADPRVAACEVHVDPADDPDAHITTAHHRRDETA